MKIQYGGGRHIEFRKMSMFPEQTTGNDFNMVFSLHVVESVSDEYNFYIYISYTLNVHFLNFL